MANCTINDYNQYDNMEEFAYNIIKKLYENETIWRLIAYDGSDALSPSKSDLTGAEKKNLIWSGQLNDEGEIDMSKYRVFQQPLTEDVFLDRNTQMRIYQKDIVPVDRVRSVVLMNVDIVTNSKINGLAETSITRMSKMQKEIAKTLNGADVNGIGSLFLDNATNRSTGSKIGLNNSKNYFGYSLTFGVWV